MFAFKKKGLHKPFKAFLRSDKLSALWITLSISALMLAGFLSIFIMLGRTPIINEYITDPHWFRRTLVVHVNLALLVWFYGFLCGIFLLVPLPVKPNRLQITSYLAAITGVGLISASIFIASAEPVLSNYIPIIDHPVFIVGILLFGGGVCLTFLDKRLFATPKDLERSSIIPDSAVPGIQSAVVVFYLSIVVFAATWFFTSYNYDNEIYYELIVWGGGHLLQFVNIAIAVVVWLMLLQKLLPHKPLSYKWSAILFACFTIPVLFSPLLLVNGTSDSLYRTGFTRYMQWGIFPVISVFIIIFSIITFRAKQRGELSIKLIDKSYFNGFIISIVFVLLSFVLGSLIQGSNTMVPAHYHASLGGITIAFMVTVYLLMDYYGVPLPDKNIQKWSARQPILFGIGQFIFVIGLAYAGIYGLARKVFGAEQQINSVEVYTGLSLLFVGGCLAIAGGILFFWIVFKRWCDYATN